ncbi:MAG: DUF58 domain-containing protein [Anaerolineae bacterium]|nr:MAG: DUF58 domain-containing protein [Anaerolineae bacterium]
MLKERRTGVIILAILSLFGGLATGRDLFFNITYLLGTLLILSFAWAWNNINWLHLSRVTRNRRTQVGRPLEERFQVRNTSIVPKLWLEVRDYSTLPGHFTSRVVNALGAKGRFSWRTTTVCLQRGRYRLGPLQLSTSDPFGLFPMKKAFEATSNVIVYPLTVEIHGFALPLGILPGGDALRRRTHYVTTNAAGVREYAPGDSFGRIHWPSSARRDRLIVKEFELDPLSDIWIVLDMDQSVHVAGKVRQETDSPASWLDNPFEPIRTHEDYSLPESTEEYAVTVAASLAQYFLRVDRAVGMVAYGQSHEILQPDRGERQLNRILETLAVIRAKGKVPIEDVLEAESPHFPRGGTLIVVTPTSRDELVRGVRLLGRRGLRIVTILVDPASFGGSQSAAHLTGLLQGSNQLSYTVLCGDNLTAVLSRPATMTSAGLTYR